MVLWFLLVLALEGLIVGALARLALPGPDPMGILATIGLGLAGSFVGVILSWLVLGHAGGLIVSILAATLLLYLHRRFVQHRPLTGPGAHQLPPGYRRKRRSPQRVQSPRDQRKVRTTIASASASCRWRPRA